MIDKNEFFINNKTEIIERWLSITRKALESGKFFIFVATKEEDGSATYNETSTGFGYLELQGLTHMMRKSIDAEVEQHHTFGDVEELYK